jgi:rRNA maturation protein Nop10
VRCPECGFTTSVSIGSKFKIPDEHVKECKHPPEKRKTTEFKDKDADCPYLIDEVHRVLYGYTRSRKSNSISK